MLLLCNIGIKNAWDKFDLNGDGEVSTREVDKFLAHLSIKLPDSERQNFIHILDRNNNGTIEFVEFVKVYETGIFKQYGM